jgi:hypothetical protein
MGSRVQPATLHKGFDVEQTEGSGESEWCSEMDRSAGRTWRERERALILPVTRKGFLVRSRSYVRLALAAAWRGQQRRGRVAALSEYEKAVPSTSITLSNPSSVSSCNVHDVTAQAIILSI